jgi:hypothetical protein
VVRFANLKHFYHRVHEQAKGFMLQDKIKDEENAIKKSKPIESRSFQIEQTQSQTQKTDETIKRSLKIGHLS